MLTYSQLFRNAFFCGGLVIAMGVSAQADVVTLTSATFTTTGNDSVITGFTAGVNSSTGPLIGATVTNTSASTEYFYGDTDPGSENAALTGLTATSGTLNTSTGTNFVLGPISATDVLFLLEYDFSSSNDTQNDDISLGVIDGSGARIGDLTLTIFNIGSSAPGELLAPAPLEREVGSGFLDENLYGVSFTLADFTGTGDISQAAGITVVGTTLLSTDVAVVGLVGTVDSEIPEPASLALLGAGGLLLAFSRHRA